MKIFCAAFMCLQFGFVIFWQKDFGAKTAHKMLVKLTPGGYSIRILLWVRWSQTTLKYVIVQSDNTFDGVANFLSRTHSMTLSFVCLLVGLQSDAVNLPP
jgi:hypothetical protein